MTTITITGLPNMTDEKQQEVGQSIRVGLFHANVEIIDMAITFADGNF